MPKIKPYNDMTVEVLDSTDNPCAITAIALAITMKQDADHIPTPVSKALCSKLIRAEHLSMFEQVSYTFLIQGISRSLLAQVTRQRTAKPMSGSQHYQDYSEYPMAVHPNMVNSVIAQKALNQSLESYKELLDSGWLPEEARQILPNACTVNYLWTIDALNLYKFLGQRLCNRNVMEMRIFAHLVLSLVKDHFPELFNQSGPQCTRVGGCQQHLLGMQCEQKVWEDLNAAQ